MVTNKEKLFKLGKKMTDRVPYKLGLEKLTEDCPEYWGLVNVLDDEMVDIALSMKQRVPMTLEEIAKAAGRSDTLSSVVLGKQSAKRCLRRWHARDFSNITGRIPST